MTAPALVQKLWNYCNILPSSLSYDATSRDDGLSILQQVFSGDLNKTRLRQAGG